MHAHAQPPVAGLYGRWLRRITFCATAIAAAAGAAGPALADTATYPAKPLRIIVGSGPGGAADLPARPLAQQLEALLKQSVVVENRPGAGTVLAARAVRMAAPDGYTLFFGNPTIFTQHLMRNGLDATKELTPIAEVVRGDLFLIASAGSGIDSVDKMVSYANTAPLRCGYVSQATVMTIAMVAAARPFKYECIPYKSLDQVIQGLMANDIQVTVGPLTGVSGSVDSQKLLLVGSATAKRSSFAPNTRTLTEQGAAVVVPFRNGLWGPPGLPEDITKTLSAAVAKAASSQAFINTMRNVGIEVDFLGPRAQLDELVHANAFFATGAKLTGYVPQ